MVASKFLSAQVETDTRNEVKSPKVMHAEPLYIDLIRDLGARKGEKEWNLGFGIKDGLNYDQYEALVEYEWAVANRLGLEVEIPFSYYQSSPNSDEIIPGTKFESLKLATQYTFLINTYSKTSAAIGYIHEFEFYELDEMSANPLFQGNLLNPFLVVAQRLGQNWHSLIYTGPSWFYEFEHSEWSSKYEAHVNLHYMNPHSNNFVGVETNMYFSENYASIVLRPQMRVEINDNLTAGLVVGSPFYKENERMSMFVRLIYEP
jgi:hypothetical protein